MRIINSDFTAPGEIVIDGQMAPTPDSKVFEQVAPAAEWTVNHNRGYYPAAVTVLDTAGDQWLGKITYLGPYSLKINFGNASFAGKVYVS